MTYVLPIDRPPDPGEPIYRRANAQLLIGVDPDKDANGVAVWERATQKLIRLELMKTPDLIRFCHKNRDTGFVLLEAGHTINYIWQANARFGWQKNASIGRDVGVNHGVGYQIMQWLDDFQIGYVEILPRKRSKGEPVFDGPLLEKLTGWKTDNKELLSAAKLVVGL